MGTGAGGHGYVVTIGLQVLKVVLGVDPDSVFGVLDNVAAGNVVEVIQLTWSRSVCCPVRCGSSVGAPARAKRRPAALVVDAFGLSLVMLALLYVGGLFAWPFVEIIRLVTFAALGLAPIAFLFALLDLRLARGEIGELLVELRADPTADLQAPLARALRDPSLRLSYWLPEFGSWADQDGRAVRRADRGRAPRRPPASTGTASRWRRSRSTGPWRTSTSCSMRSRPPPASRSRTAGCAPSCAPGLQELQGSRVRVLEAGRQERQRLERDLHDGAQPAGRPLHRAGLIGEDPAADPVLEPAAQRQGRGTASLDRAADVARGIYPAVLSGHGLAVALESLAAHAAVPVELNVDLDRAAAGSGGGRRVLRGQRGLDQHRQALHGHGGRGRPHRVVRGCRSRSADNGAGGAELGSGAGLRGLADRVEALGGSLTVRDGDRRGSVRPRGDAMSVSGNSRRAEPALRVAIAEDSVLLARA